MLEVKLKDKNLSSNFEKIRKYFPDAKMGQISKVLDREKIFPNGERSRNASKWLAGFSFT